MPPAAGCFERTWGGTVYGIHSRNNVHNGIRERGKIVVGVVVIIVVGGGCGRSGNMGRWGASPARGVQLPVAS